MNDYYVFNFEDIFYFNILYGILNDSYYDDSLIREDLLFFNGVILLSGRLNYTPTYIGGDIILILYFYLTWVIYLDISLFSFYLLIILTNVSKSYFAYSIFLLVELLSVFTGSLIVFVFGDLLLN